MLAGFWMLAACLNLAWWLASGPGDTGPGWGVASLALATACVLVYARRMPAGRLGWDGEQWRWISRAYPTGVILDWPQTVVDLQWFVVVRTRNRAGASWTLCLEAKSSPTLWHSLRLALNASPYFAATDPQSGSPGA